MKMRSLAVTLLVCLTCSAFAETPDTVLLHGKVYTGDPAKFAQAIAISGKRILAVGTDQEILQLATSGTEKLDLGGQLVIPGIDDARAEIEPKLQVIRLATTTEATWDNIKGALGWAGDESSADKWIIGEIGPQTLKDPNATSAGLQAIAKGRKIMLSTPTGHAGLWSDAALGALRAGSMSDPVGGTFGHDSAGRINGQAFEYAQFYLAQKLADSAEDADIQQALREYSTRALTFGVTSTQMTSFVPYSRLHRALMRIDTPLRVREIETVIPAEPIDTGHPVLYVVDGTPLEHGAAISGEYAGTKDSGTLNLTTAQITAILAAAKKSGQQALFDVSGDRALRVLLDALAAAGTDAAARVRVEHGDGLSGDLLAAAAKLGVVVVPNALRASTMKDLYPSTHAWYAWKSIVANRILLAFGSDRELNPYFQMMLAVRGGSEALTVAQAVNAMTRGGAFAEMAENEKGTIAAGQLADLAVLTQDLFTVAPDKFPATHAAATMIGGKVVSGALPKVR